jgi:hypothetical protein
VRIKVISPSELEPASVNPKGAEIIEYLFTNSSDKRKEKISDIDFSNFLLKYYEHFENYKVLLVYHKFIIKKYV